MNGFLVSLAHHISYGFRVKGYTAFVECLDESETVDVARQRAIEAVFMSAKRVETLLSTVGYTGGNNV